jgi:RNA polymerase sigma factor (sigma-70 family)
VTDGDAAARDAIEAVWRIEAPRLVAALARVVRDLGRAEELAQDAFVVALERWPEAGIPERPGAWLLETARRRAIDQLRRDRRLQRAHDEIGAEVAAKELAPPELGAALDDAVGDDLLRLVFLTCHPLVPAEGRVALTLRLLGGLTTAEIARAFLVPEATVAQRIVRAKRTLADARVEFEMPAGGELAARRSSVLEVVYFVFNEGYAATEGDAWTRPELCEEALRLGRIVAELAPAEPEVHGLVALMELQASRLRARVGPAGEPVLLADQDRSRWDPLLIGRGLAALARARAAAGSEARSGPYLLQAEIAACHARARAPEETEWARVAALYARLAQIAPSPVVELNRAVALSMLFGPEGGLAVVDALADEPALAGYHLLPTVRGDLLAKLARHDEAKREFERAAALAKNARERRLLLERAAACARAVSGPT